LNYKKSKWSFLFCKFFFFLFSLWAIATLTFVLMHLIPGDPFQQEQMIPQEILDSLHRHYGLDKPLFDQYISYLKGLLHGNLGPSFKYPDRTVQDLIKEGFPVSLSLGLFALTLAIFGGILFGTLASLYHLRWQDRCFMMGGVIGISVPSFILGTFLQYFLTIVWNIFPVARFDSLAHAILPALSLAALPLAFIARLTRANMIEVMQQDFITSARAKGLNSFQIAVRHLLPNSLLPVLSYLGPLTANILTGSFAIEKIFAIPGMGQWFVMSILNRDYTVIMGITLFYSFILMLSIFLFDFLSFLINPRVRYASR
jgi:oligopeptide transport system permease protein